MKKIISLMILMFIGLSVFVIKPKAAMTGLKIDTSSKQNALSSIVKIFVGWKNEYPTAYQDIYSYDAYRLYLFSLDLNSRNNWTSSQIVSCASSHNLTLQLYTETYLYSSVTITKEYAYETKRTDNRDSIDPNTFNPNVISAYTNYIGEECFDSTKEYFNLVIHTQYTTGGGDGYIYNYVGNEVINNTLTFGTFRRLFYSNQSNYGFDADYIPYLSLTYPQSYLGAVNTEMSLMLFDNDKLKIQTSISNHNCIIYITKEQHYNRCYNQIMWETDWLSIFFIRSFSLNNFFHKLGNYDLDYSNENNYKLLLLSEDAVDIDNLYYYYPYSSFENVFDSNDNLVTSQLVRGTFNYVDSSYSMSLHWAYDVIPYVIWGNGILDNSNITERLIWEAESVLDPLDYSSCYRRGDGLINNYNYRITTTDYNNLIDYLDTVLY